MHSLIGIILCDDSLVENYLVVISRESTHFLGNRRLTPKSCYMVRKLVIMIEAPQAIKWKAVSGLLSDIMHKSWWMRSEIQILIKWRKLQMSATKELLIFAFEEPHVAKFGSLQVSMGDSVPDSHSGNWLFHMFIGM